MSKVKCNKSPLISTISKSELAMKYNPNTSQKYALRILRRWIQKQNQLYEELIAAGYNDRDHVFTPKQIQIIYKFLDPP